MEQFCGRLVADSLQTQFPLAPCVTGTVKFASLASSHTNQVLRLFLANVKDWSEDALNLKKHDPEFHHAVTHGMEWTVLSADLLRSFPTMAQLVQESSNTGGQLQRREGEMQMARKVYNMWSSLSSDGKQAVRYMDIKDISFVFFFCFFFFVFQPLENERRSCSAASRPVWPPCRTSTRSCYGLAEARKRPTSGRPSIG